MYINERPTEDFPLFKPGTDEEIGRCYLTQDAVVMQFKEYVDAFETFHHFKDAEDVSRTES